MKKIIKTMWIVQIVFVLFITNLNAQDALSFDKLDATEESNCEDGIINLHINGGYAPYEFNWNGPNGYSSTQEDINNLSEGTYSVTVTDALCGTADITIELGCEPCPQLIFGIAHYGFIECEGKKGKLTVYLTEEGLAPYGIEWSNGETTETIENLDPGYYSVTVTDSRNCESSMGIDLYVRNSAKMLYEDEDLIVVDNCQSSPPNGSVTFRFPLGSGYKYVWRGPFGYKSFNQNISNLISGTYCVEVRSLSNPDCIFAKGCATVRLSTGPDIQVVNIVHPALCKGSSPSTYNCKGSVTISVPSLASIEWQNIPNLNQSHSSNVTGLCPNTNYTVEVCKDGCCSTKSFLIECCETLSGNGEPNGEYLNIIMSGIANSVTKSIILDVSGGREPIYYRWTGPNGFTSTTKNISGLEVGTYCVRVFDGCSEQNMCFEIVDCSEINISALIVKSCPMVSDGSITLDVSGGSPPFKYYWDNGTSVNSRFNISPGTYCVIVEDKHKCYSQACFTVGVDDFDSSFDETCKEYWICKGKVVNTIQHQVLNSFTDDNCVEHIICSEVGEIVGQLSSQIVFNRSTCQFFRLCSDGTLISLGFGTYTSRETSDCFLIETCQIVIDGILFEGETVTDLATLCIGLCASDNWGCLQCRLDIVCSTTGEILESVNISCEDAESYPSCGRRFMPISPNERSIESEIVPLGSFDLENAMASRLSAFPSISDKTNARIINSSQDITISLDSEGTSIEKVTIINTIGQIILHNTPLNTKDFTFNLAGLPDGLYIVKILTNDSNVFTFNYILNK